MSTTEPTVAIVDLQAHLTIVDLRVRTEEVAYYSRAHRAAAPRRVDTVHVELTPDRFHLFSGQFPAKSVRITRHKYFFGATVTVNLNRLESGREYTVYYFIE